MMTLELTPVQIRALKLVKEGNLFPQEAKKWTHLNATVTYARTDRFQERPQKIRFVTTTTIGDLEEFGLIDRSHVDDDPAKDSREITMAGKMWLMANK